jgi:hypothetical protein
VLEGKKMYIFGVNFDTSSSNGALLQGQSSMINKNSDTNIVGSSSFDPFSSVAYGSLPNTTSTPVTKDFKVFFNVSQLINIS